MRPTESISFDRISVRFFIPVVQAPTLKERAVAWLHGRSGRIERWALDDVTFSVLRGEAFAVVGANGAGKSTLLRLVTQALRPTRGRVRVRGRVAPLLGLGSGFHPELSGRENVLLTGTLLGLTRRHMESRLDSIVSFAELEQSIDLPVRTYSAGMWARLGFAIATDVQPDVLVVDEALSVGDEAFRARCSARLKDLRSGGATVLLVTHELDVAARECGRAAWLDRGRLMAVGSVADVVGAYRGAAQGGAS